MKLFIDTANIEMIIKYYEMGVVDGVTTNPTLLSNEVESYKELLKKIIDVVEGPVSIEVINTTHKEMVEEARNLTLLGPNVVIKIPMTSEGILAVKELSGEHIKTNVTLVFSPNQALLAAKVGANYVSPFIGRLDDYGHVGMDLVKEILQIYANFNFPTEVIVASIRHPRHVIDAAKIGAHIATVPSPILEKMFQHPLTNIGLKRFLKDWKKKRT